MQKKLFAIPLFFLFIVGSISAQIVITEVFYNAPNAGTDTIEYIELYNNSTTAINLEGYHFSEGIVYTFPFVMLGANEYVVVANDSIAMSNLLNISSIQWQSGALNNDGEDIQLNDANLNIIDYIDYFDGGLWPSEADGDGYSIELCDPNSDNTDPANWQASTTNTGFVIVSIPIFGTPGAENDVVCTGAGAIVTVNNNFFDPATVTIFAGETVEWINVSAGGFHNVNGTEAIYPNNAPEFFTSGLPSTDAWSYSYTFNTEGIYEYQCDVHVALGMVGTVVVLPAPIPDIVITEIMYNPPGTDAIGEYLELYNKSATVVNLDGYSFTQGISHSFSGVSMAPGEYLIIAIDSASVEALYGINARQWNSGGLANGGEDIVLLNAQGTIEDIVVYNNNNPWAEIASGEGPSLILCDPEADNSDPANWSHSINNTGIVPGGSTDVIFASPGAANTCPDQPYIFFNGISGVVNEGDGLGTFSVRMPILTATDSADVTVVVHSNTTATDGIDFTLVSSVLHFPPGLPGQVSEADIEIAVLDDLDIEGDEIILLELMNATGAIIASTGLYTITIEDNDGLLYPAYPIGTVTTVAADGVADSLGVSCSLTGIVHGNNFRPNGLEFTIIDSNNDGIGVFNSTANFGYLVTEGDLVTIEGVIDQFNGLIQILSDTVKLISQNIPLWSPDVVTTLSENTESQMVRFNNMSLVDPNQWTNAGSGFNVDMTDGTNTILMRIDADIDLFGTPPPTVAFDVIGIGGQFDNSSPYDEGYRVTPRYIPDIIPLFDPVITALNDAVTINVNQQITIGILNNDILPDDTASVTILSEPILGEVVVNSDFTITYTPELDVCGLDAFSYAVCDMANACDTAFVTVTIDCPVNYPLYSIADVTTLNMDGLPDSVGVEAEVRGIVYGVNLRPGGLQFTIIDQNDFEAGIGTFSGGTDFGYTVTEGDFVACQGEIDFFNGLAQINLDSVYVISSGNLLHDPEAVTDINESTESKLVKLFNVTLVDPGQWTNSGSGFNVDVTDGASTWQVRIDNDVDLYNEPAPTGALNITGIGGQFDSSAPHTEGYQLLPRYVPDIEAATATDELDFQQQVHLFPNPASDVLFVNSEFILDRIQIYNKLGQLVQSIESLSNNNRINTESLTPGMYIIRFEKDGHRWAEKFVKR